MPFATYHPFSGFSLSPLYKLRDPLVNFDVGFCKTPKKTLSKRGEKPKRRRIREVMDAEMGMEMESYYCILGVRRDASFDEIRRAYRKLAMQWHPDKWASTPSLLGEAKRKFQEIQEAYSVLSDTTKRAMYDAGMYDPTDEEDEGFCDFMQEMLALMSQVREEEKQCSMEDLQSMFVELAQGFDSPQWYSCPSMVSNQGCSARLLQEAKPITESSSTPGSYFGFSGMSSFCR